MKLLSIMLATLATWTAAAQVAAWSDELSLHAADRTRLAEPPKALPEFTLMDHEGVAFGLRDLQGRAALVFFGFTNCPNVCPAAMQRLRQVERSLDAPSGRLVNVLISVDGERDTPDVMKSYLAPFGSGFLGLTGTPRAVQDIAAAFSAVFFPGMPTDASGGYNVEHTSQIYLIDKHGRLAATFYQAPLDDIAAVTRLVLGE